jgi:hypothetical protein
MTTHELKTINPHFQDQFNGCKTFEIRLDDRGFQVGDTLKLLEFDKFECIHSGRWVEVFVTHILSGYPAVEDGCVVMSTERRSRCGEDGKVEDFSYQTTIETDEAILIIGHNDFWKYKSKSLMS